MGIATLVSCAESLQNYGFSLRNQKSYFGATVHPSFGNRSQTLPYFNVIDIVHAASVNRILKEPSEVCPLRGLTTLGP